MASHFANIGPVHMDADGNVVRHGVPDAVHITNMRGDRFDFADFETFLGVAGEPVAVGVFDEGLAQLSATQDTHQAPHGVVVDRSRLARAPHKTHDREAIVWVSVEQILLVALGAGLCKSIGQPVVLQNQLLQ